jgi:hypothetical protein
MGLWPSVLWRLGLPGVLGIACVVGSALGCGGTIEPPDPADTPGGDGDGLSGDGDGSAGNGGDGDGDGDGDRDDPSAPYVASDSVARRLSRAELDNVLRDLLGDRASAASDLLPEDPFSPYDNDYTGQVASAALIDSLSELADDVAARVAGDASLRARVLPCTPSGPNDMACFSQAAAQLTRRAFRRTLTDDELAPYLELLDYATEDNPDVPHDFNTAVDLLVRAVLMDPELLYRIEVGEPTSDPRVFALTGPEIATRMSFLAWGSVPTTALLAQGESGELAAAESRSAIFASMLEDPRARDQLHRFHAMWLGYRVIPHSPELAGAFNAETTALLDRVIFDEPQSYLTLFTFDETFIDDVLAEHYGLPLPGDEQWVSYGDSGRAGLLSHGALLSAFGKFTDTSPTQRGIMVRTRLLCEPLIPPPPDVMADQPPGDPDAVCKWDRYSQHRASSACASCHSQTDPIGFGLENYDLSGRYREHDDGLPECTIDAAGSLPPYGSFSGPAELGAMLVDSDRVPRCVTSQLFQFAVGRPTRGNEAQAIDALAADFTAGGARLADILQAFVTSDAFALRKEPVR